MRAMKRTLIVLILMYIAQSFTVFPAWIGRSSPDIAALLSPPGFNFHACYMDGTILDFEIGAKKEAVFNKLAHGPLQEMYWHEPISDEHGKFSHMKYPEFDSPATFLEWVAGRNDVIGGFNDEGLMLRFQFDNEVLSRLCVWKINFEWI